MMPSMTFVAAASGASMKMPGHQWKLGSMIRVVADRTGGAASNGVVANIQIISQ